MFCEGSALPTEYPLMAKTRRYGSRELRTSEFGDCLEGRLQQTAILTRPSTTGRKSRRWSVSGSLLRIQIGSRQNLQSESCKKRVVETTRMRILVFVCILGVAVVATFVSSTYVNAPDRAITEACKAAVLGQLKAPATAVFTAKDNIILKKPFKASDSLWHYQAFVDSQNGFGALIRDEFSCTMRENEPPEVVFF